MSKKTNKKEQLESENQKLFNENKELRQQVFNLTNQVNQLEKQSKKAKKAADRELKAETPKETGRSCPNCGGTDFKTVEFTKIGKPFAFQLCPSCKHRTKPVESSN